jgi:hypothetical protein
MEEKSSTNLLGKLAILLALVQTGVGFMSTTPSDYLYAKLCFSSAALLFLYWATKELINWKRIADWGNMVLWCLIFGIVCLFWFKSWMWVETKHQFAIARENAAAEKEKVLDIKCSVDSPEKDCPLRADAYGYELPHPDGSDVDGIKWNETTDSDVRITLTNTSLTKIQNISLFLKPETHVRKAVQPMNVPSITISPDFGPIEAMSVTVKEDKTGKSYEIPASDTSEYIVREVKLQGSELLANGKIKIVMACIALNSGINGELPKTLVAPRSPPKWITVYGTYETTEAGVYKRFHYYNTFTLGKH